LSNARGKQAAKTATLPYRGMKRTNEVGDESNEGGWTVVQVAVWKGTESIRLEVGVLLYICTPGNGHVLETRSDRCGTCVWTTWISYKQVHPSG